MRIDVITIFPELFECFVKSSLLAKALEKKLIEINVHNLRNWAQGKHKVVDDKPYGGGPGMVLKIEPIYKAVAKLKKNKKSKVILLTPRGKKFNQTLAKKWAKDLKQIIIISGRYEGVDERVKKLADEIISVGDFITLGGEVPAMALVEAVARLVPGVVGKKESIEKLDFPQYTRPKVFEIKSKVNPKSPVDPEKGRGPSGLYGLGSLRENQKSKIWKVPKVLTTGNHKKIEEWRKKKAKKIE